MSCGAVPTSERLETDLSEKKANLKAVFSEDINDNNEAEPKDKPVRTVARGRHLHVRSWRLISLRNGQAQGHSQ